MFLLSGDIQENIKYIYLNKPNRPMWILEIGRYLYVKNLITKPNRPSYVLEIGRHVCDKGIIGA
jgi:hypothetical protein